MILQELAALRARVVRSRLRSRVAALEERAATEDARVAAIQEANQRAIRHEHDVLARHGFRPCTCDPGEGCNAR